MKKSESKHFQLLRKIIAELDDALNHDEHLTVADRREAITATMAVLTPDHDKKEETEEIRFVRRVERLMALRGFTQTSLAESLGISQPTVAIMLARPRKPQRRILRNLAAALGVLESDLWPVETERGDLRP